MEFDRHFNVWYFQIENHLVYNYCYCISIHYLLREVYQVYPSSLLLSSNQALNLRRRNHSLPSEVKKTTFCKYVTLLLRVFLLHCYLKYFVTLFVRVTEWLLFNANSAIFQLYHGQNKLIFNEMMMKSALY